MTNHSKVDAENRIDTHHSNQSSCPYYQSNEITAKTGRIGQDDNDWKQKTISIGTDEEGLKLLPFRKLESKLMEILEWKSENEKQKADKIFNRSNYHSNQQTNLTIHFLLDLSQVYKIQIPEHQYK
jgi:hypothetical protein